MPLVARPLGHLADLVSQVLAPPLDALPSVSKSYQPSLPTSNTSLSSMQLLRFLQPVFLSGLDLLIAAAPPPATAASSPVLCLQPCTPRTHPPSRQGHLSGVCLAVTILSALETPSVMKWPSFRVPIVQLPLPLPPTLSLWGPRLRPWLSLCRPARLSRPVHQTHHSGVTPAGALCSKSGLCRSPHIAHYIRTVFVRVCLQLDLGVLESRDC